MEGPLPSLQQSLFLLLVVAILCFSEDLGGIRTPFDTRSQEENGTLGVFGDIGDVADNDSSQSNETDEVSTTTALPTTTTTPKPLIPKCPCAWVESGGFWNDVRYFYRRGHSFVASRCDCTNEDPYQCSLGWSQDQQTLNFKWFGMPDSWEYQFQMKFCYNVMHYYRRFCVHKEVGYKLMQKGTWLYLLQINCRCPYGVGYPKTFHYVAPVTPSTRHFRAKYIDMHCTDMPRCDDKDPCYSEPNYPDGKLRRGTIQCTCPRKHFCPLYYIGGRRKAVKAYVGNQTIAYHLFCVKV